MSDIIYNIGDMV